MGEGRREGGRMLISLIIICTSIKNLSVAVQRGNAASIRGTMGQSPLNTPELW